MGRLDLAGRRPQPFRASPVSSAAFDRVAALAANAFVWLIIARMILGH